MPDPDTLRDIGEETPCSLVATPQEGQILELHSNMTFSSPQQDSRLLSLPAEIRLGIYSHLAIKLDRKSAFTTYTTETGTAISIGCPMRNYDPLMSLISVCHTIHREVEDFIYSKVTFTIAQNFTNELHFAKVTTSKTKWLQPELYFLHAVRNVRIRISFERSSYLRQTLDKVDEWLEILLKSGKVETFRLDLYVWGDPDRSPPDIDRRRTVVAASGLKRHGVLGYSTDCFVTQRLRVAKEAVDRLKEAFGESES